MNAKFAIQAFSTSLDRTRFSCGEPALDVYFKERVSQDIKRRLTNCFVVIADDGNIAGFYTFASTSLPLAELPETLKNRLPRYALLPAGLIGRLAIDQNYQGQRLGSALVFDAAMRASRADPAIYALIVDAKNLKASQFYQHLGFIKFQGRPESLFLPVASALG